MGQHTDGNQLKGLLMVWDGFKWTRRTYAPPYELSGVHFLDAVHGWFTARDSKDRLYQTTDGGKTLTYIEDYFHHVEAQTPSPTPGSDMSTSVRRSYELQPNKRVEPSGFSFAPTGDCRCAAGSRATRSAQRCDYGMICSHEHPLLP